MSKIFRKKSSWAFAMSWSWLGADNTQMGKWRSISSRSLQSTQQCSPLKGQPQGPAAVPGGEAESAPDTQTQGHRPLFTRQRGNNSLHPRSSSLTASSDSDCALSYKSPLGLQKNFKANWSKMWKPRIALQTQSPKQRLGKRFRQTFYIYNRWRN